MSAEEPQADNNASTSEDVPIHVNTQTAPSSPSMTSKSLRMRTDTAEIDSTITHPGSVKINVKGAFIVDQEAGSPSGSSGNVTSNGGSHDTKDIRLPNHTAVVSHIAVDVTYHTSFIN